MSVGAGVSGSFMDAASFSASVEYRKLSEVTKSRRSVIIENSAKCSTYKATLRTKLKVIRNLALKRIVNK